MGDLSPGFAAIVSQMQECCHIVQAAMLLCKHIVGGVCKHTVGGVTALNEIHTAHMYSLTVQLKETLDVLTSSNRKRKVTFKMAEWSIDSPSRGLGAASDRSTINCPALSVLRSGISRGGPMGSSGGAPANSIH